ncbi:MAG: hypothetical protein IPK02_13170 [Candidatus Accumulibacter sp.]|uniref:Uncharacterized protein n=1 Tax=Candidatus Accumulibacter affinis TaxID=2954384 RepID=A0A935TB92_9PROT|nr:hypothetical protein [Candidatus Accumulibacter affinis]
MITIRAADRYEEAPGQRFVTRANWYTAAAADNAAGSAHAGRSPKAAAEATPLDVVGRVARAVPHGSGFWWTRGSLPDVPIGHPRAPVDHLVTATGQAREILSEILILRFAKTKGDQQRDARQEGESASALPRPRRDAWAHLIGGIHLPLELR